MSQQQWIPPGYYGTQPARGGVAGAWIPPGYYGTQPAPRAGVAGTPIIPPGYYGVHKVAKAAMASPDGLGASEETPLTYAWWAISTASTAASAYHGYKRNDSIGWAIVWGLLGGMFPVVTPAIAYAQGFGVRKH